MKLNELIVAVKEKNLSKDQLEAYRDAMAQVFAEMKIEYAELEKSEALYINSEEGSETAKKNRWRATQKGQRMIELKRYCEALNKLLDSLKSRLYSIY